MKEGKDIYIYIYIYISYHRLLFLVTAADNKQRDPGMTALKITIDP